MQDSSITVVGNLAADPVLRVLPDGTEVASFRLGATPRVRDRATGAWVDGPTSWYSVSCWRGLAANAAASLHKGQRAIVTGALRVREWSDQERSGTSVDIVADAVGHDLAWGTSLFRRGERAERPDGVPAQRAAAALGARVDRDGVLHDVEAPGAEELEELEAAFEAEPAE